MESEVIPRHTLDAVGRAFRFQVLWQLNLAFAHSGLDEQALAKRLGWRVRRVRSVLNGGSELTLRDLGVLAWAIDGSVLEFSIHG